MLISFIVFAAGILGYNRLNDVEPQSILFYAHLERMDYNTLNTKIKERTFSEMVFGMPIKITFTTIKKKVSKYSI